MGPLLPDSLLKAVFGLGLGLGLAAEEVRLARRPEGTRILERRRPVIEPPCSLPSPIITT